MFAQTDSDHVMAALSYEKTWEQTLPTVQDKYVRTSWWVDFFSPPQLCINWAWKFFLRVQRVPAIVKYSSFNCRAVSKCSPWLCRKAWKWDCLCLGNFKSLSRFFSFFPQCNHSFLVLNIVQFEKNFPYWDRPAELSPTLGDMLRGSHWDVLRELHTNIFLLNFLSKHSNVMNVGSALQARLVVQVLSLRGSAIEHDGLISWWKPIRNKPAQTWQINPTKSYARRAYTLRLVMQIQPSSTVIPGLSGCGGLMQWFVRFNENPLLREQIFFFPTWTQRTAKRKVELTTQVRHLWTSQLHHVCDTHKIHPDAHASGVHLLDRRPPPYEPSLLVVSQRNFCPNWGHGKCILNEGHDSHTQNEVMWRDAVRTRFIMLSVCTYGAHRMLDVVWFHREPGVIILV